MVDANKLKIHNMGVVDIAGLNDMGIIESDSLSEQPYSLFSIVEVRKSNPSWGPPEPRPTAEYLESPNVELPKIADILEGFSMSQPENRSKRSLRESISDYLFQQESTKNLLCIHRRSSPEFYYERAVLRIPEAFSTMRKENCPRILIVSDSDEDASRVHRALCNQKKKLKSNSAVHLLRNTPTEKIYAEVMVGSIGNIFKFIDEAKRNDRMKDLKEFLKYIVINNSEKISIVPELDYLLDVISDLFGSSWTRLIFMYSFPATQATPVLNIVQEYHKKFTHGLYIEVDTPRVRNLFDRVQFSLAVPSHEFADRMAAQALSTDITLSEQQSLFSALTPHVQKIFMCSKLILKLRKDRECRNKNIRETAKRRRERILIVTKSSEAAIMVAMSLGRKSEQSDQQYKYSVHCIITQDSVENVEQRNFEFRHGNLDVLVINWDSISAVIRGTVDAVIIFDSPPAPFFQTMMETEMENLTSRNCVKLKLYILLDQNEDQVLLPEYVKFLQKYKKRAPQWFQTLYERYRAEFNARLESPGIDNTMTDDVLSDNTLQQQVETA